MSNKIKKALSILLGLLLMLQMFPAQAATCLSCGGSHYRSGYETWLEQPTCYTTGMKEYGYCPDCYYYDVREVPPSAHQWSPWHDVGQYPTAGGGATCTEGGMQVRYCTVCQLSEERIGPPLGHNWGEWWTEYEGTCLKPGMKGHRCRRCGIEEYRYTDYGDHVWNEWHVVKVPTASEKGLEERQCGVCAKLEQRELDMLAYEGSLLLELVNAPASITGKAGDEIRLVYRLTNTGNTTLTTNSYRMKDGEDQVFGAEAHDDNSGYRWSAFVPGDSYEIALTTKLRESDIAAGQLVRKLTELGYIWFGANGIPMGWEGCEGTCSADHDTQIESNTVTATIPIVAPTDPQDGAFLHLDMLSAPAVFEGAAGDEIEVSYRLTNLSDVTIWWPYYMYNDANDLEYTFTRTLSKDTQVLGPGESCDITVRSIVRDEDMAAAQIFIRSAYQGYGLSRLPDAAAGGETNYFDLINSTQDQWVASNTVTVIVPIGDAPTPWWVDSVIFTKYVVGFEETYGARPAHAGDKIEYMLQVINTTDLAMHDVEIVDPLKGGNEDAVLTMGDTIEAHGSAEYSFLYTVTEEDELAGEIVNTGVMRWCYEGEEATNELSSNTVIIFTEGDLPSDGALTVTKTLINDPESPGGYFVEGETVLFLITLRNESDEDIFSTLLVDCLEAAGGKSETNLSFFEELAAGTERTFPFPYIVTADDVEQGIIKNTAYATYFRQGHGKQIATSETVAVPCSRAGYLELLKEREGRIELIKAVTSTPANGEYYVENETVSYSFEAINDSPRALYDVKIVDRLISREALVYKNELDLEAHLTAACDYVVTAEDVARGYIENTGELSWHYVGNDAENSTRSNTVVVPTRPDIYTDLVLIKTETSTPANGSFYVYDEIISYEITVENHGEDASGLFTVNDCLMDPKNNYYFDVVPLGRITELKSGEKETFHFSYVVDKHDIEDGIVKNIATIATSTDDHAIVSDIVQTYVGAAPAAGHLTLSKVVVGMPDNGTFYTPGEVIHYELYLYAAPMELRDVVVRDALLPLPLAVISSYSCDGSPVRWAFDYTVTALDAANGSITNVASIEAADETGAYLSAFDSITLPTGFDLAPGLISAMTIVKTETSTPANLHAYTEGEEIIYEIVIRNDGNIDFGECILYDSQASDDIGSAEHLWSGEERHFFHKHTVTAADVANGYVENVAWVQYEETGFTSIESSNRVISRTEGDPAAPGVPADPDGPGLLPPSILPGGDDACSRELIAMGDNGMEFQTHYCDSHLKTQATIAQKLQQAANDQELLDTWTEAKSLWQDDINALYNTLLNAGDARARITIMDERIRFYAAVGCHEALLLKLYPDTPLVAAQWSAEAMMNKCVDLCYMLHTAPTARVDAFDHVDSIALNLACGESCTVLANAQESGDARSTLQLCAQHAPVLQIRNRLISGNGSTVEAWTTICKMWDIEVNTGYNKLYAAAEESVQATVLADCQAFKNHQAAYEKVLLALYDQPEVAKEVLAQAALERAMALCHLK